MGWNIAIAAALVKLLIQSLFIINVSVEPENTGKSLSDSYFKKLIRV